MADPVFEGQYVGIKGLCRVRSDAERVQRKLKGFFLFLCYEWRLTKVKYLVQGHQLERKRIKVRL